MNYLVSLLLQQLKQLRNRTELIAMMGAMAVSSAMADDANKPIPESTAPSAHATTIVSTGLQPKIDPTLIKTTAAYRFYSHNIPSDNKWVEALEYADSVFSGYFGQSPNIDVVLVQNSTDIAALNTEKLSKHRLILPLEKFINEGRSEEMKTSVLAHEACHVWLISHLEMMGLKQEKDPMGLPSYGHANAPDWFDEMVAISCEKGELAARRLENDFIYTPLQEYLHMEHPMYGLLRKKMQQLMAQNDASETVIINMETPDNSLVAYYEQAAWLLDFMNQLPNKGLLNELANALVAGEDMNARLFDAFSVGDYQELDRQLREHIARNL